MPVDKPSKKTETLEIRLPPETKAAFMARCGDLRRTASEAVRGFIEQDLALQSGARPATRRRGLGWRIAAAALAGLAVGAAAVPSLARPSASRTLFERLDVNHDGVLSFEEFRRR